MSGANQHRVPASACPRCSYVMDAASGCSGKARPAPGDITICLACTGVARFGHQLELVAMTDEDLRELDAETLDTIAEIRGAMVRVSIVYGPPSSKEARG